MNYEDLKENAKFLNDNELINDNQYNKELYILDYHIDKDVEDIVNSLWD